MLPAWAFYLLLASVFVVLFAGFATYFVLKNKANKISEEYRAINKTTTNIDKAAANEHFFKILALEKAKATKPITDDAIVFAVNSIIRNTLKKVAVINAHSEYEAISMRELAKATIVPDTEQFDFGLIVASDKLVDNLKKYYANLTPGGLLMVASLDRSQTKELVYECKILDYRFEKESQAEGIVWIAK